MTPDRLRLRPANGEIPGWTDAGRAKRSTVPHSTGGAGGVNPTNGDNWLDLEASPGNNRVGQDVQGVQAGARLPADLSDAGDATLRTPRAARART